jgi:hypothetical protein
MIFVLILYAFSESLCKVWLESVPIKEYNRIIFSMSLALGGVYGLFDSRRNVQKMECFKAKNIHILQGW